MGPICFLSRLTKNFSLQNWEKIKGRNWTSFLDENTHVQLHMACPRCSYVLFFFFLLLDVASSSFLFIFFKLGQLVQCSYYFLFFSFSFALFCVVLFIFFRSDFFFFWTWFFLKNKFRWLVFFLITFLVLIVHHFLTRVYT